ncbi:MAG: alanine--tRNA ligase, partial [Candidatus Neomarinimicrobiota bacterium]
GMNQFKPIFLGDVEPQHLRVVNSQKCIRVSGKHNDLEEVGLDGFHHTFFEMLGNWSFGDYYKGEAIKWAWQLFTDVWGLDKDRLWATVYSDDTEAFKLWTDVTDIKSGRVLKFGAKENFWEMGRTGPCGPCSEIHYFVGDDPASQNPEGVNNSDQYWELWNLVFIQYNRDNKGTLKELPKKHIDTGAGLERIVTVLQNKNSNYDNDLFSPLITKIEEVTGRTFGNDPIPHQVIADHLRMLTISIADGVMPSNEGRGYVLRRILRRASRFGRILDYHEPFIYQLVDVMADIMGDVYTEINEKKTHIKKVIKAEESAFNETLDRGLIHFEKIIGSLKGKSIPGNDAFRLYDTYGFPLDLTQLMARERGLSVDVKGFDNEMNIQKKRAKSSGKFKDTDREIQWQIISKENDSEFIGYDNYTSSSRIRRWARSGENVMLVLNTTPFYGESGGQVGDTGTIADKNIDLIVTDVIKLGDRIVHICEGSFDENNVSGKVECRVAGKRREKIKRNHTATHMMQAALKQVLGDHVHQAGSLVHPDYLRFDLTHFEKITEDDLKRIETIVNREIIANTLLEVSQEPYEKARKKGAEALFGEKYGDIVRVLRIGDFSIELCGGTHVDRTGDIGFFKIIEESSLAAGVRRLVAITGMESVDHIQRQDKIIHSIQAQLRTAMGDLTTRVEQLLERNRQLEKSLKSSERSSRTDLSELIKRGTNKGGFKVVVELVEVSSMDELKSLADQLRDKLRSGVGVLGTNSIEEKPAAVVVVTEDLVKRGLSSAEFAKEFGKSKLMKGGGGGKSHLATYGGKAGLVFENSISITQEKINWYLENLDDEKK